VVRTAVDEWPGVAIHDGVDVVARDRLERLERVRDREHFEVVLADEAARPLVEVAQAPLDASPTTPRNMPPCSRRVSPSVHDRHRTTRRDCPCPRAFHRERDAGRSAQIADTPLLLSPSKNSRSPASEASATRMSFSKVDASC